MTYLGPISVRTATIANIGAISARHRIDRSEFARMQPISGRYGWLSGFAARCRQRVTMHDEDDEEHDHMNYCTDESILRRP